MRTLSKCYLQFDKLVLLTLHMCDPVFNENVSHLTVVVVSIFMLLEVIYKSIKFGYYCLNSVSN